MLPTLKTSLRADVDPPALRLSFVYRFVLLWSWSLAVSSWVILVVYYFFWAYVGLVAVVFAFFVIGVLRGLGELLARQLRPAFHTPETVEGRQLARLFRPLATSATAVAGWVVCESLLRLMSDTGFHQSEFLLLALCCGFLILLLIRVVTDLARRSRFEPLGYFLGATVLLLCTFWYPVIPAGLATRLSDSGSRRAGLATILYLGALQLNAGTLLFLSTRESMRTHAPR